MTHPSHCTCKECRTQQRLLLCLRFDGVAPQGNLDDLAMRRLMDTVVRRAKAEGPILEVPASDAPRTRRLYRRWAATAAAAAVFVGVGAVLLLNRSDDEHGFFVSDNDVPPPGQPQDASSPHAEAELALSEFRNVETTEQSSAVLIDDNVRVLVGPRTVARIGQQRNAKHVLELTIGSVLVSVRPGQGTRFAVRAPHGTIEVHGTVFEVVATRQSTTVSVLRGQVTVSDELGTRPVDYGQRAVLRVPNSEPLTEDQVEDLDRRLVSLEAVRDKAEDPPDTSMDSDTVTRSRRSTAARTDPSLRHESARDLLDQARAARSAQRYDESARLYGALVSRFPRSDEAAAALVSLGELQREKLGQTQAALASFERYLGKSPNGPLAPEALLGKAQSLRALGREKEERSVLEELARRFPTSGPAQAGMRRLQQLTTESSP